MTVSKSVFRIRSERDIDHPLVEVIDMVVDVFPEGTMLIGVEGQPDKAALFQFLFPVVFVRRDGAESVFRPKWGVVTIFYHVGFLTGDENSARDYRIGLGDDERLEVRYISGGACLPHYEIRVVSETGELTGYMESHLVEDIARREATSRGCMIDEKGRWVLPLRA